MPPAAPPKSSLPPPWAPGRCGLVSVGVLKSMKIDQKIYQNSDVILVSFLVPLGPLLASLLGVLWGLWGAQVGSSWLPKVSGTRSGLQNASLQKYHVLLCETTHSGLPGLPKTGQDRSTTAPGGFQEGLDKELFSNYFLVSILCPLGVALGSLWGASGAPFGDPWRPQIGPKFD